MCRQHEYARAALICLIGALAAGCGGRAEAPTAEETNRAKATMDRMIALSRPLETHVQYEPAPPSEEKIEVIRGQFGRADVNVDVRDAWETPFRFVRTGDRSFRLVSAGADRRFDEKSWSTSMRTHDLRADAVFEQTVGADGKFTRVWIDTLGEPLVKTWAEKQKEGLVATDEEMAGLKAVIKEMSSDDQSALLESSATRITAGTMAELMLALDDHKKKKGFYPKGTAKDLERALFPEFVSRVRITDDWGTELRYVPSPDGQRYTLGSAGADRKFDPSSWTIRGVFASAAEDAVIVNGEFVREWDGKTSAVTSTARDGLN